MQEIANGSQKIKKKTRVGITMKIPNKTTIKMEINQNRNGIKNMDAKTKRMTI